MNLIQQVTEDHMVAAFVQAEMGSPDFGGPYRDELRRLRLGRAMVDAPDLADEASNVVRRHLLATCGRGYPTEWLFKGWPTDVEWWRAEVTSAELADFKFLNDGAWIRLSGGSRVVKDGVANVGRIKGLEDLSAKITQVAGRVREGYPFPELLLVATTKAASVVVMEGNTRATAFVLAGEAAPGSIPALAGFSPQLASWPYLGKL